MSTCVRYALGSSLIALCVVLAGCATVKPWEREAHARRGMQVEPDPASAALDQHVYEYREGSSGGYNAHSGSGCGCN